MATCPVCQRHHDGPESNMASRVDGTMEIELGAICSLPCAAEMIMRLDPDIGSENTCPGCPNCQPMKFARPDGRIH